jgi:hypothetical protein
MAEKQQSQSDVTRVAKDLFVERSGRAFGRDMKAIATNCFKDAQAFIEVSDMFAVGLLDEQIKPATGIQLCDVHAPNLVKFCKNHPHNLVSRKLGDLEKVAKAYKWLKANPLAETCSIESLGIEWDIQTTKLARILLPEYVPADEREPVLQAQ